MYDSIYSIRSLLHSEPAEGLELLAVQFTLLIALLLCKSIC